MTAPTALAEELEALHRFLEPTTNHRDVAEFLRARAWSPCGAGDWAIALLSPDGQAVARISPFDPVALLTARVYRNSRSTGLVPRLLGVHSRDGGGNLLVMERLFPASAAEATEFLRRLHSWKEESDDVEDRSSPKLPREMVDLARTVTRIHAGSSRTLPWFGPLDTNPSNIMRHRDGHLVLIDPYYADGPNLYATAQNDPDLLVARIPEHRRRYMTEIPLVESGPWPESERAAMRDAIRKADARATTEAPDHG
jgi:hypothetical protein